MFYPYGFGGFPYYPYYGYGFRSPFLPFLTGFLLGELFW